MQSWRCSQRDTRLLMAYVCTTYAHQTGVAKRLVCDKQRQGMLWPVKKCKKLTSGKTRKPRMASNGPPAPTTSSTPYGPPETWTENGKQEV